VPYRGVEVDGKRIRELREDRLFERRELAELIGINYHSLYRIEAGIMNTSRPTLRRLALALGVAPNTLRSGSGAGTRRDRENRGFQATKGA
jgi:transcriptional regulator with XRE-family HTH domain